MKAIIYIRVSTEAQDYDRQLLDLQKDAAQFGYDVVGVYKDKDSGYLDSRPDFDRLKLLTREDTDFIMVWELSRLYRKSIELQAIVRHFTERGLMLFSHKENFYTHDSRGVENPSYKMVLAFMSLIIEQEVPTMKARMKAGRDYKIIKEGQAYTGAIPHGYAIDSNKKLVIDPESAKTVQRIFQLSADGYSHVRIAKLLNAEGVLATNRQSKYSNGQWLTSAIPQILKNTVYIGYHLYCPGKPNETLIKTPQIISQELWDRVQEGFIKRKHRSASVDDSIDPPLLRGLIICYNCGLRLTRTRRDWLGMYECPNSRNPNVEPCKFTGISVLNLNEIIWTFISRTFKEDISAEKSALQEMPLRIKLLDIVGQIQNLAQKSADIDKQIETVTKQMILTMDISSVATDTFRERIKGLESEKTHYIKEGKLLMRESDKLQNQIETIGQNVSGITNEKEKYDFVHKVIDSIKIFPGEKKPTKHIHIYLVDGREFVIDYKLDYASHRIYYVLPDSPDRIYLNTKEGDSANIKFERDSLGRFGKKK